MEEAHRIHKDVTFGWVAWLRDLLAEGARARRERAIQLWGDNPSIGSAMGRPDDPYRLIRTAFGPRF